MGQGRQPIRPGDILEIQRLREERHKLLWEHLQSKTQVEKNRISSRMERVALRLTKLTGQDKW